MNKENIVFGALLSVLAVTIGCHFFGFIAIRAFIVLGCVVAILPLILFVLSISGGDKVWATIASTYVFVLWLSVFEFALIGRIVWFELTLVWLLIIGLSVLIWGIFK